MSDKIPQPRHRKEWMNGASELQNCRLCGEAEKCWPKGNAPDNAKCIRYKLDERRKQ